MAKNRLDDRAYAIKKIIFNENNDQMRRCAQLALQEVRILASLSHPNIVQYHCAWLELVPMGNRIHPTNSSDNSKQKMFERKQNDSLDRMIEFQSSSQNSAVGDEEQSQSSKVRFFETKRTKHLSFELFLKISESNEKETRSSFDDLSADSSCFESKCSREQDRSSSYSSTNSERSFSNQEIVPFRYHNSMVSSGETMFYMDARLVLFIQMQICDQTLHDWLDFRKKRIADDFTRTGLKFVNVLNEVQQRQCWQIYKQILSAVTVKSVFVLRIVEKTSFFHCFQYLHSQSFVHRDVKPKNIFICADPTDPNSVNVKLGDFGLAALIESETTTSRIKYSTGESGAVGTALYAAPEQLNPRGFSITEKADSFSLGIVLFELFNVYPTEMERISCLTDLRVRQSVDEDFLRKYPLESEIINQLVLLDVSKRPSIGAIFKKFHQQIQEKSQKPALSDKKVSIEKLRKALRRKDERIQQLENEIKNLSS